MNPRRCESMMCPERRDGRKYLTSCLNQVPSSEAKKGTGFFPAVQLAVRAGRSGCPSTCYAKCPRRWERRRTAQGCRRWRQRAVGVEIMCMVRLPLSERYEGSTRSFGQGRRAVDVGAGRARHLGRCGWQTEDGDGRCQKRSSLNFGWSGAADEFW